MSENIIILQAHDKVLEVAISASKKNSNYLKDKKEKAYALHPEVEKVLAYKRMYIGIRLPSLRVISLKI